MSWKEERSEEGGTGKGDESTQVHGRVVVECIDG
jgi:hypothetical protein